MSYDFIFVVLIECSERFCSQDVSTLLLEVLHLSVPSRCLRLFCLIWSSTTVAFSSSPSVFIILLCTSLSDSRICHQQIYRLFAIYSRLSPANLPNICYWQSTVTSKFTEYLLLTVDYHQPLTRKVYITMFLVHLVQNCIIQLEKCKNMLKIEIAVAMTTGVKSKKIYAFLCITQQKLKTGKVSGKYIFSVSSRFWRLQRMTLK